VCVGSGLQLKTWVSAVAAVLCFAAEKRLCAASKRANQRRPARRVRRTSSSHQSSLKPKARDLSASRKTISAEVLCSCDC
jgi:hypothetical protein